MVNLRVGRIPDIRCRSEPIVSQLEKPTFEGCFELSGIHLERMRREPKLLPQKHSVNAATISSLATEPSGVTRGELAIAVTSVIGGYR